ncbi:hypothetical protein CR205_12390 [Alteribacter lacisalsi]|uniref:Cxxc_20_cxxc protein n=1 Tax=Alteribacter lacisalsi TaxID=2045244 RepID=A0A2W0H8X2_9BACI|nr:TIGR04104 family putative zinc finger protein [Alteribacter lacisalsi]PYZ96510.1 hypothetical protein CR205_12390 [Alteribacter lacisalsi]
MPECRNCGQRWTWRQTMRRSLGSMNDGVTCLHCEGTQYVTRKSRIKGALCLGAIIIPIPIVRNMFPDLPDWTFVSLMAALMVLFISLYPYLISFSNENEPLIK